MNDITSKISSEIQLKRLNSCRFYLQVTFLSEITDLQGIQVNSNAIRGEGHPHQKTNLQWPPHKCPDKLT